LVEMFFHFFVNIKNLIIKNYKLFLLNHLHIRIAVQMVVAWPMSILRWQKYIFNAI